MFIIRQATLDDATTLFKLAKMVHFINLPADLDIIQSRIVNSRKSFAGQVESDHERQFMFVVEDTETGNVVGTSSIISAISWPGRPHTFLQVRRREHYSDDLQEGHVHVTLQLGTDETGPSEIGGLILSPVYRGHRAKLGAQLSLVRFHYLGLHRQYFNDRIIAEMMGALTPDSSNLLWEYLGRKFINLGYAEADRFCQQSKEFITALFPREEIYATMLPAEARNLIGKVGEETKPAKAMLERLGFRYKGHIDPFDGGPYLEARVDEIDLVTQTTAGTLAGPAKAYPIDGFVSGMTEHGYRAMRTSYAIEGDQISLPDESAAALCFQHGQPIGVTPLRMASDDEITSTSDRSNRAAEKTAS